MFQVIFERAINHTANWARDESGNATVDWVVLVAGLVALSVVVMGSVGGGVEQLADNTEIALDTRELSTY